MLRRFLPLRSKFPKEKPLEGEGALGLRIVYYNHMYGHPGIWPWDNGRAHWFHILKKQYEPVIERADIARTIEDVRRANADIVVFSEVLGWKQRAEMEGALQREGYHQDIHFAQGHLLNPEFGHVEMLVATRMKTKQIFNPKLKVAQQSGRGGGMIGFEVPSFDMTIFGIHTPLPDNIRGDADEFDRQVELVLGEADKVYSGDPSRRIIVMGDWNMRHEKLIEKFPELRKYTKISSDDPTCSMTHGFRLFDHRCVDYMLGLNVGFTDHGIMVGHSDHALVWVDV